MLEARTSAEATSNTSIILSTDISLSTGESCDIFKALPFKKDWRCLESNTFMVDCVSCQHVPARGGQFPIVAFEMLFIMATALYVPKTAKLPHFRIWQSIIDAASHNIEINNTERRETKRKWQHNNQCLLLSPRKVIYPVFQYGSP